MTYEILPRHIIEQVSGEFDIPQNIVWDAYRSIWEFIRKTIEGMDFRNGISEKEMLEMKTSFNLPSLGKMYTNYDVIVNSRKKTEYIIEASKRKRERLKYKDNEEDCT